MIGHYLSGKALVDTDTENSPIREMNCAPHLMDRQFATRFFQTKFLPYGLPAALALVYAIVGAVWIAYSDFLISDLGLDGAIERSLQTYKGWLYVGLSSIVLFVLLSLACRWILQYRSEILRYHDRISLALKVVRGGLWERDLKTSELYISAHVKTLVGIDPDYPMGREVWRKLIHPDDLPKVIESTRRCLENPSEEQYVTYRVRHTDGSYRWLETSGKAICDSQGKPLRLLGFGFDVTHAKESDDRIKRLIHYDHLTGLPNLFSFRKILESNLAQNLGNDDRLLCIRLDVDDYSATNAVFTAHIGDQLLREIAARLEKSLGGRGVAAHLGGDEFALLIRQLGKTESVQRLVNRFMKSLAKDYRISNQEIKLTLSMGVTLYPSDASTADELLTCAELALSKAINKPGNQIHFYAPGMNEASQQRTALSRELAKTVTQKGLDIYFQPIVNAEDHSLYAFEALLRWNHPSWGFISPTTFVPIAEDTGLIKDIGYWVLYETCAKVAQLNERQNRVIAAVNVSPLQLDSDSFVSDVKKVLKQTNLTPSALELEITESALMTNVSRTIEQLQSLRSLGVGIAIDDFGTGYSSLVTLRDLPVTKLKIDRSFVSNLETDNGQKIFVRTILELAKALNITVTAEGVETKGQSEFLTKAGCDTLQGYLFAKPAPMNMAEDFLSKFPTPAYGTVTRINSRSGSRRVDIS